MGPKEDGGGISARVILALDTDSLSQTRRWVKDFLGRIRIFKVGGQLFTSQGRRAVEEIKALGGEVFLDLKFHDIPNTVGRAAAAAAALGVRFFDVHALGGEEMIARAVDVSREEAERLGLRAPAVLVVTLLTSLDERDLRSLGIRGPISDRVLRLSELALRAGAQGVVASPHEVAALRKALGAEFLIVTPGIRLSSQSRDDQKRSMTPQEALRAGADYLVMGRSLLRAEAPERILDSLAESMAQDVFETGSAVGSKDERA